MTRFFAVGSVIASTILGTGVYTEPWSNVKCVRELWSQNSRQQSPCLVSAYLGAPCVTNDWGVEALETGDIYGLPARLANPCLCNTVLWNLLSACSMCQSGSASSWTLWTTNCSVVDINIGKYPLPIPAGTTVPHWAYYDFTDTGVFNAAIASQQSGPESTAEAGATATSSATPNLPQATVTQQSQQSQSANNTGAIVGGTVGGMLGLAIIGLIAFVIVRKSKREPEPASHHTQSAQGGYNPPTGTQPGLVAPTMAQYQLQPEQPGMVPAPSTRSGSTYKRQDLRQAL